MESRVGGKSAVNSLEELQHLLSRTPSLIPDEAVSPLSQAIETSSPQPFTSSALVHTTTIQQGSLPSSLTRGSVLWNNEGTFEDSDEENAAFLERVRADRRTVTQTFNAAGPRADLPKPPRTLRQKLRRTKIQAGALLKNPKVDLQFAQLPRGVNNKIEEDRDPLKDRYKRWRNPPPKPQRHTPWNIYDEPEKRSYYVPAPILRPKEGVEPAPSRFAPAIKPQAEFKSGPLYDEWCNPFGGEHAEFHASPEDRAQRVAEVEADVALRKESDTYLGRQGRCHFNDWKIGRPPPMSRRLLDEPLKRRLSRARRRQSDLFKIPETPVIPEVNPKDLRPSPGDRAYLWDRAFLSSKTSVAFSNKSKGNTLESAETTSPGLLSSSFDKTSDTRLNSIDGPLTLSSFQDNQVPKIHPTDEESLNRVSCRENKTTQRLGFFRNSQRYLKNPCKSRPWEFVDSDDESSSSCYSRNEDDTSKTLQATSVQGETKDDAGGLSDMYTEELQGIDNFSDDDQCRQYEITRDGAVDTDGSNQDSSCSDGYSTQPSARQKTNNDPCDLENHAVGTGSNKHPATLAKLKDASPMLAGGSYEKFTEDPSESAVSQKFETLDVPKLAKKLSGQPIKEDESRLIGNKSRVDESGGHVDRFGNQQAPAVQAPATSKLNMYQGILSGEDNKLKWSIQSPRVGQSLASQIREPRTADVGYMTRDPLQVKNQTPEIEQGDKFHELRYMEEKAKQKSPSHDDPSNICEIRALQIPSKTTSKPDHSPLQPNFYKGSPIRRVQTNTEKPHSKRTVQPDVQQSSFPRRLHRSPKLVVLKSQRPLDHPSSLIQQASESPVHPAPLVEIDHERVRSWLNADNAEDELSKPPVSPVRLARKNQSHTEQPLPKTHLNISEPPARLAPGVPSDTTKGHSQLRQKFSEPFRSGQVSQSHVAQALSQSRLTTLELPVRLVQGVRSNINQAHSSQLRPPPPRPFPYDGTLVEHSLETSFGNLRANSTSTAAQWTCHSIRNTAIGGGRLRSGGSGGIASGNLRGGSFHGVNFWNRSRHWESISDVDGGDDEAQNSEKSQREKPRAVFCETGDNHHLQSQTSEVGVSQLTPVHNRQVHAPQTTPVQDASFEPVNDSRRDGGSYTTPVRNAFLKIVSGSGRTQRQETEAPQASPVQNAFLKPMSGGNRHRIGESYITPVRSAFFKNRQQRPEAAATLTPSATFESEGNRQRRIGRPEVTENLGLGAIFETDGKREHQIQRPEVTAALAQSATAELAASGATSHKNSGSDGTTASFSPHAHARKGSLPPGALYAGVRAQATADHASRHPSSRSPHTCTRFEAGTGPRPLSYHLNQDEQLSLADPRPKPAQSTPLPQLPQLTEDIGEQFDSASREPGPDQAALVTSIAQSRCRVNRKRENTVSRLRSQSTQSAYPPVLDLIHNPNENVLPVRSRPLHRVEEPAPVFLPTQTKFQNITEEPFPPSLLPTDTKAQVSRAGIPAIHLETPSEDKMDRLSVNRAETNPVKLKAKEDAKQMWGSVMESTKKTGKPLPNYLLNELIGKGSFGRVYKARNVTTGKDVAVKIIDIDESDTINPRNADSYSEFLKEVNALKLLSESKARNINHVIEALPVGQSMWMVTEYCGGGSVATLMKPTSPGGLQEKWIIPILREVAEAIKWVHQAGIIHRDIKCANVLITEQGGVQLCDFGVAGTIETKLDKRSTIIGTPHWMAPELFDATPSYGKEVDIWAFGAMVYEIATGLPPNVANGISYDRLGSHLKQNVPRLEGGSYSNDLRNLIAYCLEELPSSRPTIEQVQKHPYIFNTALRYPETTLSHLVRAFKMWEDSGGNRRSLFSAAGAQGPSELSSTALSDDSWNFSTTAAFDQEVLRDSTAQDVYDVYGTSVDLGDTFSDETARPSQQKGSRRRPPPGALAPLRAPLEKIFDPNTLSNYEDNSRSHYGRLMQQPASDLPLRDDSAQTSIRDTLIDLGGHDAETGLSSFPDMNTIKAIRYDQDDDTDEYSSNLHDFSRPAHSDPADNSNRRTQDWKFPSMIPPASADSELSRFPNSYDLPRPSIIPGSGGRPTLIHHPTEPVGAFGGGLSSMQNNMSRLSISDSLIDLDMSMPDPLPNYPRPSTADSDAGSVTSESASDATVSTNPFELERHASLYQPIQPNQMEPSIYVNEESAVPLRLRTGNSLTNLANVSDFSSDAEGPPLPTNGNGSSKYDPAGFSDSEAMPPPPRPYPASQPSSSDQIYTVDHIPPLPELPIRSLANESTHEEFAQDIKGSLRGLNGQLRAFRDVYNSPQIAPKGSMRQRRDGSDGGASGSQV